MVSFSMKREPGSDHCYSKKKVRIYSVQTIGGKCGYMSVDIISYVYYSSIITTYYSFMISEYCPLRIIS